MKEDSPTTNSEQQRQIQPPATSNHPLLKIKQKIVQTSWLVEQYNALQKENEQLKHQVERIESEKRVFQGQIQTLSSQFNHISSKLKETLAERDVLTSANTDYSLLKSIHQQVVSDYEKVQNVNKALMEEKNNLEAKLETLEKEATDSHLELEMLRSELASTGCNENRSTEEFESCKAELESLKSTLNCEKERFAQELKMNDELIKIRIEREVDSAKDSLKLLGNELASCKKELAQSKSRERLLEQELSECKQQLLKHSNEEERDFDHLQTELDNKQILLDMSNELIKSQKAQISYLESLDWPLIAAERLKEINSLKQEMAKFKASANQDNYSSEHIEYDAFEFGDENFTPPVVQSDVPIASPLPVASSLPISSNHSVSSPPPVPVKSPVPNDKVEPRKPLQVVNNPPKHALQFSSNVNTFPVAKRVCTAESPKKVTKIISFDEVSDIVSEIKLLPSESNISPEELKKFAEKMIANLALGKLSNRILFKQQSPIVPLTRLGAEVVLELLLDQFGESEKVDGIDQLSRVRLPSFATKNYYNSFEISVKPSLKSVFSVVEGLLYWLDLEGVAARSFFRELIDKIVLFLSSQVRSSICLTHQSERILCLAFSLIRLVDNSTRIPLVLLHDYLIQFESNPDVLCKVLFHTVNFWPFLISDPNRRQLNNVLRTIFQLKELGNLKDPSVLVYVKFMRENLKWSLHKGNLSPAEYLKTLGLELRNTLKKHLVSTPVSSEEAQKTEQLIGETLFYLKLAARYLGWPWTFHQCLHQTFWPLLSSVSEGTCKDRIITVISELTWLGIVMTGPSDPAVSFIRQKFMDALSAFQHQNSSEPSARALVFSLLRLGARKFVQDWYRPEVHVSVKDLIS